MSDYKKGVIIGIGIEALSIICVVLCVWQQMQVPGFIPFTMFTGMIIALSASFAVMRADQKDSSNKKSFSPIATWIVFALLVILTAWLTMSSAFGL